MDLQAIKDNIAQVCSDAGYAGIAFAPETVSQFGKKGAVIVHLPTNIKYKETEKTALVTLPLTVVASADNYKVAQGRLSAAIDTSTDASLPNLLAEVESDNWTKLHVESLGDTLRLIENGGAKALAIDIVITVRTSA